MPPIDPVSGGVRLTLHIQPRASTTEVAGIHGDALKLRIASPPVDGAANDEIVRFLAEQLGVPRRQVTIISGATGRRKTVAIAGVDRDAASRALGLGLAPG